MSKQQRELGGHQWASQLPTDGLKDGQESEVGLGRLEEERAELEKKSAAVIAETRQRVCPSAYVSKQTAPRPAYTLALRLPRYGFRFSVCQQLAASFERWLGSTLSISLETTENCACSIPSGG